MLQIKTKIKLSELHGIGLFADEFIPKGTIIFKESIFTKKFTELQYEELPQLQKNFIKHYGYFLDGMWKLSIDNDRFMNHSYNPNTAESDFETTIALIDINIDEEITCDYDLIGCYKGNAK